MTRKPDTEDTALECLREAVAEALERKRRLGQYAVVWRNGRPQFIDANPPVESNRYPTGSKAMYSGVAEPGADD
jgi:hypothetical protein